MVMTGLQQLAITARDELRGRRIGLITQPAAVLPTMQSAEDALLHAGVTITALFGPEHGFDGSAARTGAAFRRYQHCCPVARSRR